MLTDNVLSLPSTWCLDNILLKDVSPESWKCSPQRSSGETDLYDETELDRVRQFHDYCGFNNLSTGTSIASSDCSDDFFLDLEAETEDDLFGDLASSVLNIIQDIKETEEFVMLEDSSDYLVDLPCDNCTKLSSEQESESISPDCSSCVVEEETYSIDISCSGCSNYSSKNSRHRKQKNRKWNDLNEKEKVSVVDQLSQRISRDLGLREQLEVIRMIDPKSHVSPTDKQFLIDITNMTEEKIERIQDYIKTHCCIDCQSDDNSSTSSPRKSKKRQLSNERKNRHRNDRQKLRKESRQIKKEKRSGLFVKEEVLSMSRLTPPPEDEDIDILG